MAAHILRKKWPTWRQVGFQNRATINKTSMQKSIKKLMPSKIDVWSDVGGFLERTWRHVGTKINEKSMQNARSDFLINRALAAAGAWSVRFWGSKLGAKTHQKTIKKWSQHGKASWHRFLMDFGGFWEASWEGKSNQEASKMASKKRWKNEGQQDGQGVAFRISNVPRPPRSRPLGSVWLLRGRFNWHVRVWARVSKNL